MVQPRPFSRSERNFLRIEEARDRRSLPRKKEVSKLSVIPIKPTRDLIGYRDEPPAAAWPGEARIAVNFCINYEEGGELCILNGDDRSETRISDVAVEARLGRRDLNIESSYEYGSRVGY